MHISNATKFNRVEIDHVSNAHQSDGILLAEPDHVNSIRIEF